MSHILHDQNAAYLRRLDKLAADCLTTLTQSPEVVPSLCRLADPHRGPHAWISDALTVECCPGLPDADGIMPDAPLEDAVAAELRRNADRSRGGAA